MELLYLEGARTGRPWSGGCGKRSSRRAGRRPHRTDRRAHSGSGEGCGVHRLSDAELTGETPFATGRGGCGPRLQDVRHAGGSVRSADPGPARRGRAEVWSRLVHGHNRRGPIVHTGGRPGGQADAGVTGARPLGRRSAPGRRSVHCSGSLRNARAPLRTVCSWPRVQEQSSRTSRGPGTPRPGATPDATRRGSGLRAAMSSPISKRLTASGPATWRTPEASARPSSSSAAARSATCTGHGCRR